MVIDWVTLLLEKRKFSAFPNAFQRDSSAAILEHMNWSCGSSGEFGRSSFPHWLGFGGPIHVLGGTTPRTRELIRAAAPSQSLLHTWYIAPGYSTRAFLAMGARAKYRPRLSSVQRLNSSIDPFACNLGSLARLVALLVREHRHNAVHKITAGMNDRENISYRQQKSVNGRKLTVLKINMVRKDTIKRVKFHLGS